MNRRILIRVAILVISCVCLLTWTLPATAEVGTARSRDELLAQRERLEQKLLDYNRTKEGTLWSGFLSFCVCNKDPGLIIWATDIVLSRESGGMVVNRCRETAGKHCGGCTKAPALDLIEVPRYGANP